MMDARGPSPNCLEWTGCGRRHPARFRVPGSACTCPEIRGFPGSVEFRTLPYPVVGEPVLSLLLTLQLHPGAPEFYLGHGRGAQATPLDGHSSEMG